MSKKARERKLLNRIKAQAQKRRESQHSQPSEVVSPFEHSRLSDMEAPEGFRVVTLTQATMEFVQPLQELAQQAALDDMNRIMQIGIAVWNFTLPLVPENQKSSKDEIVEQICEILDMDETDAIALFDEMIERKAYLFPEELQPVNKMICFMRKEQTYVFERWDETQQSLAVEPIPQDNNDLEMVERLRRLDKMIADREEYDTWENVYLDVEQRCCDQYFFWLQAKGAPAKQQNEFPFCVQVFLNFVYRYDAGGLQRLSAFEVEEFLFDHLLRKVVITPNDYVYWPPALRLFYTFLSEKGYLDDPHPFHALFNALESEFLAMLKKQC